MKKILRNIKMILKEQENNNMETNDNTQLCENEEEKDESIDKNKEPNILKKESNNVMEFYDVYP